ncbi:MAG: hypothetical protein AUI36_16020, partial [Cyanobacteria bacterium 13_1_40CM_2_61_4]
GAEELRVLGHQQFLAMNELRQDFLLWSDPRYVEPRRLNRYEGQVLSQFGEDGIISEVFKRIGEQSRYFVEFGAGDGIENNSAALLLRGWKGFWIEGDSAFAQSITTGLPRTISDGRLTFKNAFVTPSNIESLFQEAGVPQEFDMLSIDIDGNDYWVWSAIHDYSPRLVVAEYNATFGPDIEWVMKYNPDHRFDGTNYFGSSLKSLERLSAEKGYRLVGCNLAGVNAFFVRQDLASDELFLPPFTSQNHFEPARYYLYKKLGKPRSYRIFDN